jgi:hypothetical protein
MIKLSEEKNFRNWFNKLFPNGFGGYNSYYVLTHPWEFFEECWRQVRWAWQRIFRKYDDRVIWNIDCFLTEMLPIWIRQLKRNKDGIPRIMWEEGMTPIDENYNYSEEDNEIARLKWENILDNIAEGFEAGRKIQDWESTEELVKKFDEGFDLFKKYFFDLWD